MRFTNALCKVSGNSKEIEVANSASHTGSSIIRIIHIILTINHFIMNRIRKSILLFAVLFLGLHSVFAQTENPVIAAIQKEVDRNKTELKMEGMAPSFFISYSIMDRRDFHLSASLGSITSFNESHFRRGIPTLLVGDYHRNNLNLAERRFFNPQASMTSLYDNESGIPITIWKDLDGVYKNAAEQFKTKMAMLQQQTQTKEEENTPDFEQVKPVNMILQPVPVNFDKAYWENYLRKTSETAQQYPDILSSNVSLNARNIMTYTYNTEGSRYAAPVTFYQLTFTANTRANDGQDLSHTIWVESATFEQTPSLATFSNRCKTVMENLVKLKNAPVIDDAYCGPVLFEDWAVGRIFEQTFFVNNKLSAAPKLIQPGASSYYNYGNAPQDKNDFELMLNKKVISRSLTIKSITGQEFYRGQKLNGYYPVDAEGVIPDKELTLIENGVLRNMLNGRKPTQKIQHSNGHARYDFASNSVKVMAGNVLVVCNQTFSNEELRKKLLDAAKEEDLEYAYIVKQYEHGTNLMYKIYVADGREELVRGATVSDLSLRTFKRILGASDKEQIGSYGETQMTLVYPDALLFEEMDITRIPNIEFKKPYIVPKPK
jgi:predicted Zn-dependent protease